MFSYSQDFTKKSMQFCSLVFLHYVRWANSFFAKKCLSVQSVMMNTFLVTFYSQLFQQVLKSPLTWFLSADFWIDRLVYDLPIITLHKTLQNIKSQILHQVF